MNTKEYYLKLRKKFLPKKITKIFILESPPVSGKYFYNPDGKTTEALFNAMMKSVLDIQPKNKLDGLTQFQKKGYIVVDSTYTPINRMSDIERNKTIINDYHFLILDLKKLVNNKTKIILVKANVCKLLESKLVTDGFKVANNGLMIPFPACGNQNKFKEKIQLLL